MSANGSQTGSIAEESARLDEAQRAAAVKRAERASLAQPGLPHFRVAERGRTYRAAPALPLLAELDRMGPSHPLVFAGLAGGNVDELRCALFDLDDRIHELATATAHSAVGPTDGWVSQEFVLDEIGRWAQDPPTHSAAPEATACDELGAPRRHSAACPPST